MASTAHPSSAVDRWVARLKTLSHTTSRVARLQRLRGTTSRPRSPAPRRTWWDCTVCNHEIPLGSNIPGMFKLPPEYSFRTVPFTVCLKLSEDLPENNDEANPSTETIWRAPIFHGPQEGAFLTQNTAMLASSSNVPKLMIGLIQAAWVCLTLYLTRGDQTDRYGYAAFGLTVAPNAFMSVVNTVGNLFTPQYASILLVRTPDMSEAERDGGFFFGAWDVEIDPNSQELDDVSESRANFVLSALSVAFFLSLLPLAVIGALSGFRAQQSTYVQRGFTLSWLVLGIAYGWTFGLVDGFMRIKAGDKGFLEGSIPNFPAEISAYGKIWVVSSLFGVVFVGGFVVVRLIIAEYGICSKIS